MPLIILILLIGIVFLVYRKTNPILSGFIKTVLVLLRLLAIVILILVLARPLLGISYVYKLVPQVAVLIDNSSSMLTKEGGQARAQLADSVLSSKIWPELSRNAELKFYAMADSLYREKLDQLRYFGKSTALGQALISLQIAKPELSAAIMITDGGHNSGPDPAPAAGHLDFPVYTVGIGREEMPRDLAIEQVEYPEEIYLGTPAVLKLLVSASSIPVQKLKVILKENQRIIAEQELVLTGEGRRTPVTFQLQPPAEGVQKYEVSLPLLEGEATFQNNQRKFSLRVSRKKLKVLCVAGDLNWEYHFLRKFLESQENLDKSYLVYDRQKLLQGNFPSSSKELGAFDLVILVNPGREFLSDKKSLLDDLIQKQGRSALFILDEYFVSSSTSQSLAAIVPFEANGVSLNYSQFNLSWAEFFQTNPILRLSGNEEENQKLWQELPPFLGMLLVPKVRPETRVLAAYQRVENGPAYPILLTQEFGQGKVMTTLAFPFWRWDFLLAGLGKENEAYSNFWNNTIRWLTAQRTVKGVEITTDRLVYRAGEKINFQAVYRDELGENVTAGEMKVVLRNMNSKTRMDISLLPDQEGEYQGSLNYLEPGEYMVEATYRLDGKAVSRATQEFQVEEYSLEDQTLTLNRQLLTQIAEVSGGKFYTIKDFENLPQDLVLQEKSMEENKTFEIWNQPLILVLALAFLSLEWFLRKRHQLP